MPVSSKAKSKKVPQSKKPVAKNATEEKWLFIKSQAVVDSTPAMKRSIDRLVGDIYTKTAADYRAKDGTAIRTAITAERLIAERLGKTATQRKAIEAQSKKKTIQMLNSKEHKTPAKKAVPKKPLKK
ncbi:hypothetical protein [Spiroplasma citri]|uniref:Uncharacterized protein n=1 Tax=Spiroplasma citri TaxID=2133 RepID=A0AAJ4JY46_SPICI|nr:hypothetical protein [Spiroplasma citri]APE74399.1 hypothetical protein SCITRI_00494 [Spiroplasma citri]QED24338.1 hypothetical protein FRX96_02325 [Spiroplasma citri]QIA66604.1 hypothetical protein GMI18_02320 [Spiroplasma citri]QIA68486.1 hypothetical protein GL298_02440 [Spiroplasma citri]QIA70362.1 hypothetical protein GL981_02445 [Spiroplasma citri]